MSETVFAALAFVGLIALGYVTVRFVITVIFLILFHPLTTREHLHA